MANATNRPPVTHHECHHDAAAGALGISVGSSHIVCDVAAFTGNTPEVCVALILHNVLN
jgi:hypothetical protein